MAKTVKNVSGSVQVWAGAQIAHNATYEIPPLDDATWQTSASLRSAIENHQAEIGDGTSFVFGAQGLQYLDSVVSDGNFLLIGKPKTISSASDEGIQGQLCWDINYIYICVGENQWKRSSLSSW